jgi:hypothetical protein
MNEYQKRVLYSMIWKARENCAGSSLAETGIVLKNILDAKAYAEQNQAGNTIIGKLMKALEIMRTANSFYDRLPADNILCEILNKDLGD